MFQAAVDGVTLRVTLAVRALQEEHRWLFLRKHFPLTASSIFPEVKLGSPAGGRGGSPEVPSSSVTTRALADRAEGGVSDGCLLTGPDLAAQRDQLTQRCRGKKGEGCSVPQCLGS